MVTGGQAFVGLCLLAAAAYGISDFAGGLASRRSDTVTTLLYGNGTGLAVTAVLLPLVPGVVTGRGVLCAVAAGVAGLVGLGLMYQLMASEPLNLVSPMTAVLAAVVPLAFGVLTGEAPHLVTWFGMGAGLVALVLFTYAPGEAEQQRLRTRVIGLAFLAGVGFGAYFILQARAGSETGLWPLLLSRVVSLGLVVLLVTRRRARTRPVPSMGRQAVLVALVAGALDAVGDVLFVLASRHGFLSLASVIVALYPAVTVLLAVAVLRERAGRIARFGLALSAVSLAFIAQ
jgi:drug/metabolite transporter (DMT)-like permease